MSIATKVLR